MIRKFTAIVAAALVLGGCATGGYGYHGGGGGDYYYGRSNGGYHDGYDGYGYDRYGYGGYGFAPAYYGSYYDGYYYGGGRPYYPYYPQNPPGHGPDRPRTVVVPNKRLPGFDYPPGATRYPNRPGGVRGPLTVHTAPGVAGDGGPRVRRTEVPVRAPGGQGQVAGPARQSVAVPQAPVRSAPRPSIRESRPDAPQPRMRSAPSRPASGSRVRSQER